MRQTMEKCFIHFKLWFFVIVEEVRLPKKKKEKKNACLPFANVSVSHLLCFEDYAVSSVSLFSFLSLFHLMVLLFSVGWLNIPKALLVSFVSFFCFGFGNGCRVSLTFTVFILCWRKSLLLCWHVGFIHRPHFPPVLFLFLFLGEASPVLC